MNRIKLTILFIFFCVLNYSQSIELVKFDNSKTYTPGSGVSMHINPTGVFVLDNPSNLSANTNNSFILELSSPGGDFTNSTNLGIVNDFYTPLMNGVIPDGTAAGEYKLRVRSTNPITSVESDSFSIVDFTTSSLPTAISNIAINTNYFECLNDGDNIINPSFGSLKQAFDATVADMPSAYRFLQIAPSNTSNSINVNIIDILSGTTAVMTPISPGVYVIPDNLEVGTYNIEVEELDVSGNSSFFSFTFLFHTSATTFGTPGIDIVCTNTEVEFNVDISILGIGRNYMGSYYTFNWGDGSAVDVLTHAELIEAYTAPLDLISHTFILPSCTVGGGSSFDVKMDLYNKGLAVNGTDPSCEEYVENGTGASKEIITSDAPQANFTLAEEQCITENIIATNTTINGSYPVPDGSCSGEPTFTWFYKPPSASDFIPVFDSSPWLVGNDLIIPAEDITTPGCWTIKLSAVNPDFCQIEDIHEDTINIEDIPDADFDIMNFGSVTQDLNIEPGNTTGTGFYTSGNSYTAGQTGKLINVSMQKNAICDTSGGFSPTLKIYQGQVAYDNWGIIGNPPLIYQKSFTGSYWNSSNSVYGSYGIQSGWFTMEIPIDEAPTLNAGTQYSIVMTGSGCNQFIANNDPANTDVNFIASGASQYALDNYVLVMKTTMLLDPASGQNTEVSQICANEIVELLDASNIVGAECDNSLPDEDPTYQWTISPNSGYTLFNSTTLTSQSPQVQFNSVGNYTITQTVTTECGSDSFSSDLEVIGNPSVSFAQGSQTYCLTTGSNLLIDFANELTPTYSTGLNAPNSYTWTVSGDGIDTDDYSFESSTTDSDAFPTIQLNSYGTYNITVTANSNCDTPASDTIVIALSETPIITNNSNSQLVCSANASLQFDFTSSISNTTYSWVVNENENLTGFFQSGTTSFIPSQTITNLTNTDQDLVYEITPISEGCVGTPFEYTFNVVPVPIITDRDETICDGETFNIQPTQNNTDENNLNEIIPIGTLYEWSEPVSNPLGAITGGFSVNEGVESISQTLTNLTDNPATLTYTVTPHYFDCIGDSFEVVVTVNPTVGVNAIADQVLCNGDDTLAVEFSTTLDDIIATDQAESEVGIISYIWTNDNTDIGLAASGIGNIPSFTATNDTTNQISGNITVTALYTYNGVSCQGESQSFTITVNPSPQVDFSENNQTIVSGETTNDVNLTSPTDDVVFSWTASVPSGISGITTTSGTDYIPEATLINTTNQPLTVAYTAIATGDVGFDCEGLPTFYFITVNPLAMINPVNDQIICDGDNILVEFSSDLSGGNLTYSWTNDNPNIGLSDTGTGNIDVIATNTTNAPISSTIVVTPSFENGGNTNVGDPITFEITVNPTGQVNSIGNQIVSNGFETSFVEFSTININGTTTYDWLNDLTSIGLAASGTGNIPAFSSVNSGTSPITAIVNVTPTFENGGVNCEGPAIPFEITVNPTAQVNPTNDFIVSNGDNINIPFTTINSGGTTTYNWSNSDSTVGLTATGFGDIDFTVVNNGTAPVTTTVVVTPTFENGGNSNSGPTETFTITINPTAQIDPIDSLVFCNEDVINPIEFTTQNTGGTTTYTWTNDNTSIGLAASGTGTISDFTVLNSLDMAQTANIVVTPTFDNGGVSNTGSSESFTITVNPTAQVELISDLVYCNEDISDEIVFDTINTDGVSSYSWTNDNTDIGLAAAGNGNIPSFTTLNTSSASVVSNIIVTPSYTNNGVTCDGPSEIFTITVNPTAQVEEISNQILCNGETTEIISFDTINTDGVSSYSWTNDNTDIGLASSGNGDILAFTVSNPFNNVIVSNITVTPTYTNNGISCSGPSKSFTISVNPTAHVDTVIDQVLCNGETTESIVFTTINSGGDTVYNWTNDNTSIGLPISGGTGDIGSFVVTNDTSESQTATFVVTPVFTSGGVSCEGPTETFTIIINPTAQVNTIDDQDLCEGEFTNPIEFTTINNDGTTTFEWTNTNPLIGLAESGVGNIPSFEVLNNVANSQNAIITVTPTYTNNGVECTGPSKEFILTVNPTAQVNSIQSQVFCNGDISNEIIFNTSNTDGITTYDWTNDNSSIGLSETGTGSIPSFELINVSNISQVATISVIPTYDNNGVLCTGAAEQFTITVNPSAQVNDTTNYNTILCDGEFTPVFSFSTSNNDGLSTFNWTNDNVEIGLADSGVGGIPSFQVSNPNQSSITATITVTPTYENNGIICDGDSETFTIVVNPSPVMDNVDDIVLCNNENSSLIEFTTINTDGITSYSWTNNNTTIGLTSNGNGDIPSFTAINNGVITETATITVTPTYDNNGIICVGSSQTFSISVLSDIEITGTSIDALDCADPNSGNINITVGGGSGDYSFVWSNGATTEDLNNIGPGEYSVTVTDSESCSAISETFNIFRQEDLTVQLDSQIIPFCENNLVTQENRITINGGLGPYTVNWSAGSVSIDDNTFMTAYQNGLYTVLVTDQYGCQVSTDILVDFEELGEPSFDYDSSGNIDCGISIYNELTFINTSSGDYTNVVWDFGDGSSVSTGDTTTHQYLNSGSYTVTQTVEYNYGCIEVYYQDIEISDGYDIVLPTAFSPNGDGINDTMRPVYACVNDIEMSIYDTFGSLIYYENNLDLFGWDGTLNGKLAENGNYLITVKGTTIYDEEINLNGVFVLLR